MSATQSNRPWEDRFWAKVEKGDSCWLWTSAKTKGGYGEFHIGSRVLYSHRLAYELLAGPIPEGLTLDHLCRVRHCVNPAHLEAVSNRVNVLRGNGACARNARKTHCAKGHALLYFDHRGYRTCRQCGR